MLEGLEEILLELYFPAVWGVWHSVVLCRLSSYWQVSGCWVVACRGSCYRGSWGIGDRRSWSVVAFESCWGP